MALPITRNTACPCGSGLRFKACRGRTDEHPVAQRVLAALEQRLAEAPADPDGWLQALDVIVRERIPDADIGGAWPLQDAPALKVAVVTAYAREDLALLRRAHDSVLGQTYPCRHLMVADGFPRAEVAQWDAEHRVLETPHRDYGDVPPADARAPLDRSLLRAWYDGRADDERARIDATLGFALAALLARLCPPRGAQLDGAGAPR